MDRTIAVIIILLCTKYFLFFTAINAATSNNATQPLMMAFAFAKRCRSNPRSTSTFILLNAVTATNTTTENSMISVFAFLSFFFQTALSILFILCFPQYNQKYSQSNQCQQKHNAK